MATMTLALPPFTSRPRRPRRLKHHCRIQQWLTALKQRRGGTSYPPPPPHASPTGPTSPAFAPPTSRAGPDAGPSREAVLGHLSRPSCAYHLHRTHRGPACPSGGPCPLHILVSRPPTQPPRHPSPHQYCNTTRRKRRNYIRLAPARIDADRGCAHSYARHHAHRH